MRFRRHIEHENMSNTHEIGGRNLKGNRIRHCRTCKNRNCIIAVYTPVYSPKKHPSTDEYGRLKIVEYNNDHSDVNAFLICKECARIYARDPKVHERLARAGAYIINSTYYEEMDKILATTKGLCMYAQYYHPDYKPNDQSNEPYVIRLFLRKDRQPLGYFCSICWEGTIYIKPADSQDIKWQNGISVYRTRPLQREGSMDWPEFDALKFYTDMLGL